MNSAFCKFFEHGLVYNNNVVNFTVAPCCFYKNTHLIDPNKDINDQLASARKQWLVDDVTQVCKICINHERSGIPSFRQAAETIVNDSSSSIAMLTVAVNKTCNLACASCSSTHSSTWHQQNIANGVVDSYSVVQLHKNDHNHQVRDRFLSLIKDQNLEEINYIKFGGGEPLMNDTHQLILSMLPYPERVTIQYTSNFSIMPKKEILDLWSKFKLVRWSASLDGVGDRFEYLRWPYKWDKLSKFVKQALEQVPSNVMFGVEHTLNPLNILYFDEFQTWFDKEFSQNRQGDRTNLDIHQAHGKIALDKTTVAMREHVVQLYGNEHKISNLINQIPVVDPTSMLKYLDQLTKWRGVDWATVFPEAAKYYK